MSLARRQWTLEQQQRRKKLVQLVLIEILHRAKHGRLLMEKFSTRRRRLAQGKKFSITWNQ